MLGIFTFQHLVLAAVRSQFRVNDAVNTKPGRKETHQQVGVFKILFPEGPDLPLSSDVPHVELHAVGGNTLDVEALTWTTKGQSSHNVVCTHSGGQNPEKFFQVLTK